jgi:hypothetical protein
MSLPHRLALFLPKQGQRMMVKLCHKEQMELHHHRRPHRQAVGAPFSILEFAFTKQWRI